MAGLLGVFADYERELIRERVKAGIIHAQANGKPHGRPAMAQEKAAAVWRLVAVGLSQGEIARRLLIHRCSVGLVLAGPGFDGKLTTTLG
jgi:DNA invertase Pin-like site-specific DNA recombinase